MTSQVVAPDENISEIDEALRHLSLVPEAERGAAWQAYADALLERRNRLEGLQPRKAAL